MMRRVMASPRVLAAIFAALGLAATPLPSHAEVRAAGSPSDAEPQAERPVGAQTEPASTPTSAPGGPVRTGVVRAELVIEALLGDDSANITERSRVRGEALLRNQEVLPARDADDPRIRIRIEAKADGSGYRCRYGAYRGDAVIAGSDGVSVCELCTQAELVDHVEAAIERVVPRLPVEVPVPVPAPTPAPRTPDTSRAPWGVLGKTGIGVTGAGMIGVVAGAVLVSRPTGIRDSGIDRQQTDYRTPGIVVLSIGLGVAVAGVALILVDRYRARRGRAGTTWRAAPVLRF